jgi:hypothetical protein
LKGSGQHGQKVNAPSGVANESLLRHDFPPGNRAHAPKLAGEAPEKSLQSA